MRLQRDVVLQQLFVVRDDQDAHLRTTDPGNAFAGEPNRIGVEATVSLIEDGKPRS